MTVAARMKRDTFEFEVDCAARRGSLRDEIVMSIYLGAYGKLSRIDTLLVRHETPSAVWQLHSDVAPTNIVSDRGGPVDLTSLKTT
jgi:hypothetical protein